MLILYLNIPEILSYFYFAYVWGRRSVDIVVVIIVSRC